MGAKWLRLESDIVDHPKTGRLETALGEPLAGWYVIRALSWMSRFCPAGHVRDNDGTSLESSAKWKGTPGKLLEALVSCGWLDVSKDGWEWHDWADHQGKVAAKATKERARKAAYRAKTSAGQARDNDGTSAGRPAQRDVTGRDVTGRVKDTRLVEPPPSKPRRKPSEKPPDPRHAPLVAELDRAYTDVRGVRYPFTGRDAKAVSTLLGQAYPSVVVAAWRRALAHRGFPSVATLSELSTHLARFLTDAPPGRGPVESSDWSQETTFGEVPL